MGTVAETVERELKLGAGDEGFDLPDLPGASPLEGRVFVSTYYDTEGLSLARASITFRRQVEEGSSLWQLKLPRGDARAELEAQGGGASPPPELERLLVAHLRDGGLAPVAALQTRREGVRILRDGSTVAEVVVDHVEVLEGRRVATRFQELEVELLEGDARDLRRLGKLLRRAGAARSDGRPKLTRVLDVPDVRQPKRSAGAGAHLRFLLSRQVDELLARDPGVRLGTDEEDLHRFRVATRRLRALLRAGRPLLGSEAVDPLVAELRWLGSALGSVRDLDVLIEHLREEITRLGRLDAGPAERLVARLEESRAAEREAMLTALESERYLVLLTRLEQLAGVATSEDASRTTKALAAAELKRLRRSIKALVEEPTADALHRVRIKAKRARYAAELAELAVGKPAARVVAKAKVVQDVIGSHQDAVVAEERIRSLLSGSEDRPAALAAGRLIEREHRRRERSRELLPAALDDLLAAGRRAWS